MIFGTEENKLLVEMEKQSRDYWNVPREVGQLLYFLLRAMKAEKVLEIGTSNGYSGVWMAKALGDGGLTTVESKRERYDLASQNFLKFDLKVRQVLGHAPEVLMEQKEIADTQFDFVFIDGTKREYANYLKAVDGLLNAGGMIVFDNVVSHAEKMAGLMEEVRGLVNYEFEILEIGAGLLVMNKLDNS